MQKIIQSKANMKRFTLLLVIINAVILYGVMSAFFILFDKSLSLTEHIALLSLTIVMLSIMACITWLLMKDMMSRLWYMQDILRQAADGVARVDAKGKISFSNPTFCQYFEFDLEVDAAGYHWQKLFAEQSVGIACHKHQEALQNGKVSFEAMAKTKNQQFFPVNVTIIRNHDDKNKGFYLYVKDLTSEKVAQREALLKHQELRQLFDNLPILIFYKDNANNILRANKMVADLLGTTIKDLEGKSLDKVFPERSTEFFKQDLKVLQSKRATRGILNEFKHLDGKKSWIKTDKFLFKDVVNKEDRILVISQDVTNMKLAEMKQEELIDDLQHTNKELERFAYVCAHDLQEPIRLAASYSEKLSDKYSHLLKGDTQAQKYIHYIHHNMQRSHEMMQHLLNYAHIKNSLGTIEQVDIKKILTITKDIMKYKFHKQKVKMNIENMPKINANREQMLQLFKSVIDNAFKFQKKNQTAYIDISADEDEHYHIFEIRDNGIGIAHENLENIFDIFKRLNKSEDYDGVGVGLAVAQRIVSNHGGTISASSDGKNGTKITFTLAKEPELLKSNEGYHGYKQLC